MNILLFSIVYFLGNIENVLVQQLINNIRGKSENVPELIALVSTTSNEILTKVLSIVWCQVTIEDEKKTFIKLISACALSSHIFCTDILLKEVKFCFSIKVTEIIS